MFWDFSNKFKSCPFKGFNHYHELTDTQELVNFGTGEFVADKERIPLLKAMNECGLITRTHCYGHETGYSFVSVLVDEDIEIREVKEGHSNRKFPEGTKELLIIWKRTD